MRLAFKASLVKRSLAATLLLFVVISGTLVPFVQSAIALTTQMPGTVTTDATINGRVAGYYQQALIHTQTVVDARDRAIAAQNSRDPVSSSQAYADAINADRAMRQQLVDLGSYINSLPNGAEKTALQQQLATARSSFWGESGTAKGDAEVAARDTPGQDSAVMSRLSSADASGTLASRTVGNTGGAGGVPGGSAVTTAASGAITSAAPAAPQKENLPKHPLESCGFKQISMCIAGLFYVLFVDLTAPLAYLGGAVFDVVAALALQGGTYASDVIAKGWTIARDIANMAFVFILIYLAFTLILNLDGAGIGKKLVMVIAVALLINFSFFFSRVVIDATNLLALQFYNKIYTPAAPAPSAASVTVSNQVFQIRSISENVMAGINPQTLVSNRNFQQFIDQGSFGSNLAILLTLFFVFGVMNIILAFVFLTAAVQFLIRILSLWFAILLSPLGFIGMIIPYGGLTKKWWHLLISNAFYAPAFLFVIYILMMLLDGGLLSKDIGSFLLKSAQDQGAQGSVGTSALQTFLQSIVGVLVRLGVVVGLFIGALKVGSFVGAQGADIAQSWGKKIGNIGVRTTVGAGIGAIGWAGRRSVGNIAYRVARSEPLRNFASGKKRDSSGALVDRGVLGKALGASLGAVLESGAYGVASSSFDARALTNKSVQGLVNLGDAQKGGYIKTEEVRTKSIEARDKRRATTDAEKDALAKIVDEKEHTAGNTETFATGKTRLEEAVKLGNKRVEAATEKVASAVEKLDKDITEGRIGKGTPEEAAAQEAISKLKTERANAAANLKVQNDRQKTLTKAFDDALAARVGDKTRSLGYADLMEMKGFHHGLWPTPDPGAKEAASKIRKARKSKSKEAQLAESVEALTESSAPPAAPTPPAGGAPPARTP